jgi:hypothetical protein
MYHETEGVPKTIGQIHTAFWNVERHLRHLFNLLELVDSEKFQEHFIPKDDATIHWSSKSLPELYCQFMDHFIDQLTPASHVLTDPDRLMRWSQTIVPARSSISFLLESVNSCGSEEV